MVRLLSPKVRGHLPAFHQAFAESDIPWGWSVADDAELLETTVGFERMCVYADTVSVALGTSKAGRERMLAAHKRKNQMYAAGLSAGEIHPRKGFVALVKRISELNLYGAIVTTSSLSNWRALCDHCLRPAGLSIEPVIEVCGADVSRKKPDPEAYRLAVRRLSPRPSECLAIEDSRNGLVTA